MTGKFFLDFPTVYSVDRQRCQNERPNERGFTASYGSLHEKYTSEDPSESVKTPLSKRSFPVTSLTVHSVFTAWKVK